MIFILETAAVIYAYTEKDNVLDKFKEEITKAVTNSYGGESMLDKGLTEGFDWFEANVSLKS